MRKKIALTVAMILLITLSFPITAFANPLQELPGGPTFDIETGAIGFQGEEVTVSIHVRDNPGFSAVGFEIIGFETSQLELVTVSIPNTPAHVLRDNNYQAGSTWVSLVNPADNNINWTQDGHLVDLVFRVLPNAPLGRTSVNIRWTGTPFGAPTSGTRNPDGSTVVGGVYMDSNIYSGSVHVHEARDGLDVPGDDERRLTVNLHGGVGGLTSRNITRGEFVIPTGTAYIPTRTGFSFLHWSRAAGGPPVTDIPSDPGGREVLLHAVWSDSDDITTPGETERRLTVNLNGGVGGLTSRNIPRGEWTIPTGDAYTPARTGFTFIHWSLVANGPPVTAIGSDPGGSEVTLHAVWASANGGNGNGNGEPYPTPPPVPDGFRRIILNSGGGHWGVEPPPDWGRYAPLGAGSNITAIHHDVAVGLAMPTFHTPWVAPAPNQTFSGWSRERTEIMSDFDENSDPGDWASTAQWTTAPSPSPGASPQPSPGASPQPSPGTSPEPGNGNGGGGTNNPSTTPHPGTTAPPAGVTRPTGAGNITVIEHFGTWTGSGTRTARVEAEQDAFVRLWFGDRVVLDTHLTIGSGSTTITLSEAFMRNLSDGSYTFISEFTGGHATLSLVVSRGFGTVPQTGVPDIAQVVVLMGIALYLTVAASVMLYFHIRTKKRQKVKIDEQ